jgi:hypothetical protein
MTTRAFSPKADMVFALHEATTDHAHVRRTIAASDESDGLLFAEALRQSYNGEADPRTLKLLRHE